MISVQPGTPARTGSDEQSAFLTGAGLVVDDITGSRVTGHIELGPDHHTPWGVGHGGVYATAVESAASGRGSCR
jgi:acyl-coenzyme A thioesterase PaaI-like protein